MNLLWDTHTFLWFVSGNDKIGTQAKSMASHASHGHFISIASLWEISIKTALKKLNINGSYESVLEDVKQNSISILPISFEHTLAQHHLPFIHRDPFDRIIASQAIVEGYDLISKDLIFDQYFENEKVKRIW